MVKLNRGGGKLSANSAVLTEQILSLRPKALWRAFWSEHFAFICISVYLFFEYVKPEQQYPIFGVLPFQRFALLGSMIGLLVDKRNKIPRSQFNWLIPLFLLHCFVSSIFAYRRDVSFQYFDTIYLWVVIYFTIIGVVNTERRLFLFVLVYFICNLRMSEFGFFLWVSRGFSFASYGITGAGWFRNSGELGMQMSMFFAYSACFIFFLNKYLHGWVKWLIYFFPISALGCVLASSSRGAIVGIVGVLFYLSLFSKKKIRAWLASCLLGYLAFLMMPAEFLARFNTVGQDRSSLSRIAYWANARKMMDQHPYLGVGYYNWVPYYSDYYYDPEISGRVELAHNTFLQTGAEVGYVGLSIFVVMIMTSFFVNWRSEQLCRQDGFEFLRSFAIGMNAACTGMVIASLFLTATYMPNYWFHFALTVCLYSVVRKKRDSLTVTVPDAGRHKNTIVANKV